MEIRFERDPWGFNDVRICPRCKGRRMVKASSQTKYAAVVGGFPLWDMAPTKPPATVAAKFFSPETLTATKPPSVIYTDAELQPAVTAFDVGGGADRPGALPREHAPAWCERWLTYGIRLVAYCLGHAYEALFGPRRTFRVIHNEE
jgi:hypothetical protein